MKKVHIVGGDTNIERMFTIKGWQSVSLLKDPDLIQFTGGSDVDPSLYNEERHPSTHTNPSRDSYEAHIFHKMAGTPMAGICRGGQFLNVMCGGRMWQDVNNHTLWDVHKATTMAGEVVDVTSTHHQMMRPTDAAEWLLEASISTIRCTANHIDTTEGFRDCEAVLYPENKALCFQPHPEYMEHNERCVELYFEFLERLY